MLCFGGVNGACCDDTMYRLQGLPAQRAVVGRKQAEFSVVKKTKRVAREALDRGG